MLEPGRMNDFEAALALSSVPCVITVLIGILISNAGLDDLRDYMPVRFDRIDQRFDQLDRRSEQMNAKWRAELKERS